MLMAAGLGTRLRPFTEMEPKALLPLMGVPMAQFSLDAAVAAGVERVVANIHHHADRAQAGLELLDRGGAKLLISDESKELLGSAGGQRFATPLLGSRPFFLLNADVLCDVDLNALARAHQRLKEQQGVTLTLTVFPSPPICTGGFQREAYREIVFNPADGLITGLGPKTLGKPFFVGAAVLEPEALQHVPALGPSEFVSSILNPAIKARKAGVFFTQGQWHDVGSPALWLEAHVALIRGLETGTICRSWRARIEQSNRRIASELWAAKNVSPKVFRTSQWVGPAYWNSLGDSTATAPENFGPQAVLYGTSTGIGSSLNEGIGYRGVWTPIQPNLAPE
ncbi:sugar phosphate nucleotidyltransferase [Bdellovibrionota bacterium FG-1]